MAEKIFTGFGFGPIQGGLFIKEAFQSGNFSRIVVAEIDSKLIDAVRANKGSYYVNVARADGIEILKIDNIEILNPNVVSERKILVDALSQSTEIATALPSVDSYDTGGTNSVASLIAQGLQASKTDASIIYTAENNNQAAEILEGIVSAKGASGFSCRVQFLNTVIGKMSRVVRNKSEIVELGLRTIVPDIDRAFLVEEFNRILVTRNRIEDFKPGIEVFIEKDDLLPFEEAKLYGHNAIHALLAYLGALKGYKKMAELKNDANIFAVATDAFLNESGRALVKKYADLNDELFTDAGYKRYAEDLLQRITNPYLADTIERAGRDPLRKLAYNDRIFGTMALALEQGIEPLNMALGAMAGIAVLPEKLENGTIPVQLCFDQWHELSDSKIEGIIRWIWGERVGGYAAEIIKYVQDARKRLAHFVS